MLRLPFATTLIVSTLCLGTVGLAGCGGDDDDDEGSSSSSSSSGTGATTSRASSSSSSGGSSSSSSSSGAATSSSSSGASTTACDTLQTYCDSKCTDHGAVTTDCNDTATAGDESKCAQWVGVNGSLCN